MLLQIWITIMLMNWKAFLCFSGFKTSVSKRDFLVVQWLRFHAPSAEDLGSILGLGTRSHMLQQKMLCATAKTRCNK